MKKLIWLLVVVSLMLITTVSAQGTQGIGATKAQSQTELQVKEQVQFEANGVPLQEQNQIRERVNQTLKLYGLENALVQVNNAEAVEVLQRNMERIQEKHMEQIAKLTQLHLRIEGNETFAQGKAEGKFLGLLKVQKTIEYRVDNEGSVTRVQKWYDALIPDA